MAYLNESFLSSFAAMVAERTGDDVESIVAYDEDTRGSGGCETCYFEWTVVSVKYQTVSGEVKDYEYDGDFMELVNTLLSFKA